jgi:Fic family protein
MFYMSAYLEANRDDYYAYLLDISERGAWTEWCQFFLSGVRDQAEENTGKAQAILELYEALKPVVVEKTNSQYAIPALDWLFDRPIFKGSDFVSGSSIPDSTARRILRVLRDEMLVKEIRPAAGRRPATYTFPRLLNIADGSDTF